VQLYKFSQSVKILETFLSRTEILIYKISTLYKLQFHEHHIETSDEEDV